MVSCWIAYGIGTTIGAFAGALLAVVYMGFRP